MRLKEYFKRNAHIYLYIYAALFPKYFCRADDYGVKSKVAFDIAYAGYKNKQENIHFICEMPIKQEVLKTSCRKLLERFNDLHMKCINSNVCKKISK